jgi:hypothetical protein
MGSFLHNGVGSLQLIRSFSGVQGAVFQKSPLEIVKGTKRVRTVGWAVLNGI